MLEGTYLLLANSDKLVLIDARDREWLQEWKWFLVENKGRLCIIRRKEKTLYLHREIYRHYKKIIKEQVGHANGNKLDNRLDNLVIVKRGRRKGNLFTPREEEVIHLKSKGLSRKQIAMRLYVEPATINQHLSNVYRKLGVNNYADMVQKLSDNNESNIS